MENTRRISEYFADVETYKEHNGYFCSVQEALTLVLLGSFCGLRSVKMIHEWAKTPSIIDFLREEFGIINIPCYYWLLCLMKLITPESFNRCFMNWTQSLVPESLKGCTVSFDGKTIRSTGKMKSYKSPLHIVSAYIAELGITFGQQAVYDKSNEIPAVQNLIKLLNLEGCMVVADALNCQKGTAKAIIEGKADYLLNVKDNHSTLKQDIEDYVQSDDLRENMDTFSTLEKNRERVERRTAFTTHSIDWLYGKEEWESMVCIGAIRRQFTTLEGMTDEWHYYISSRKLTAEDLLKHARSEWSVETMHWLLDVHFAEDYSRIKDDSANQNLNTIRKVALNYIRNYKNKTGSKLPISRLMFACLLDCDKVAEIIGFQ